MYEFLSISASSYDPAGLAAKLTDFSAEGWDVVSIVQTGGDVTAFVRRLAGGSNAAPAAAVTTEEVVAEEIVAEEAVAEEAEPVAASDYGDTNAAVEVAGVAAMATVGGIVADDDDDWVISSESVPAVDLAEVDLPEIDLPAVDMADIDLPAVDMPDVNMPDVDLPAVDMPDVDMPAVDMADIDMPAVDMPDVDVPEVEVPDIAVPEVDYAQVSEPAGWAVTPDADPISASYEPTVVSPTVDDASYSYEPTVVSPVVEAAPYVYEPTPPPAAAPVVTVPAGWYADPAGRYELRYWDGLAWTEHVARGGQQYTDPPVA
jgi:hypothetical protein